jgi:hypothetical protein
MKEQRLEHGRPEFILVRIPVNRRIRPRLISMAGLDQIGANIEIRLSQPLLKLGRCLRKRSK